MNKEPLPIEAILPELVRSLEKRPAAVIRAPTGSGKTTRVPPALLDSGILGSGKLILLQPRRVAARACAHTMAAQRCERIGETVGYQIRFEKRSSKKTKILVATEGILTRRFQKDPFLEGVACVILDEFHERSIHTDLALAFLRELMTMREDLKVVVMSATLDAEPISDFLFDCPVLSISTRTHPLAISYSKMSLRSKLSESCEEALNRIFSDPTDDGGNVLVFLPGVPEINRVLRYLIKKDWGADIMPLHGSLDSAEQDRVLQRGQRRRIILSTNVAETSLTIPGVTAVVDSGLRKTLIHDPGRGIDRLDTVPISRASADQRAGRAGRTGPGRVIRLWDPSYHATLKASEPPEIATVDLSSPLLQVMDFYGSSPYTFPFFEPPPEPALKRAVSLLTMLGAVGAGGKLTERGKRFSGLPLHPRLAMILEAAAGMDALESGAFLCAILSEPRRSRDDGDFFELMDALSRDGSRSSPNFSPIRRVKRQLLDIAKSIWPGCKVAGRADRAGLVRMVLSGFPDRLCRSGSAGIGLMVGGRGVAFDPVQVRGNYFVALELIETGRDRGACKAGVVVPATLEDIEKSLSPVKEEKAVFDESSRTVRGIRITRYRDLILEEKPGIRVSRESMASVLAAAAQERFDEIFRPKPRAEQLRYRILFAKKHLSEEDWPDVSVGGLRALLPQLCHGKRGFAELADLDWYEAVNRQLTWSNRQMLDREIPEKIEVPSGREVVLDYKEPFEGGAEHPVLAVRLQELFGWSDSPRLARGRVTVLFHILAPNMRPCQITRDLRGFWDETYTEVRKELRRRYPKHYWPEDPWSATAIRGVRRPGS